MGTGCERAFSAAKCCRPGLVSPVGLAEVALLSRCVCGGGARRLVGGRSGWGVRQGCPLGFCITPSPLGGALRTSRDGIFCVAGPEGGVDQLPGWNLLLPLLSPLPQASLRANIPAGPSISLCPPSLCTGRLSETRRRPGCQEGWGCRAWPSHSVTPPVPETLQALDLSGHPATQRQGLSGGLSACGIPLRSALLATSSLRKEEPYFILFWSQKAL